MGNLASISFLPQVDPMDTSYVGKCGGISSRFLEENGPVPAIIFPSGQPLPTLQNPLKPDGFSKMDECMMHPHAYIAEGWKEHLAAKYPQLSTMPPHLVPSKDRRDEFDEKQKCCKKPKKCDSEMHNARVKMIKDLHEAITKKKEEDDELDKATKELLDTTIKCRSLPKQMDYGEDVPDEPVILQKCDGEDRKPRSNILLDLERKNLFLSLENRILYEMVVQAKSRWYQKPMGCYPQPRDYYNRCGCYPLLQPPQQSPSHQPPNPAPSQTLPHLPKGKSVENLPGQLPSQQPQSDLPNPPPVCSPCLPPCLPLPCQPVCPPPPCQPLPSPSSWQVPYGQRDEPYDRTFKATSRIPCPQAREAQNFYQYDPTTGVLFQKRPQPECISFPEDGGPLKIRTGNRIAVIESRKQLEQITAGAPFFIRNDARCRSASCSSLLEDMSCLTTTLKSKKLCDASRPKMDTGFSDQFPLSKKSLESQKPASTQTEKPEKRRWFRRKKTVQSILATPVTPATPATG